MPDLILLCRCSFIVLLIKFSFTHAIAYESIMPLNDLKEEIKNKDIALISLDVEITQIKPNKSKDANMIWSVNARENIIKTLDRLVTNTGVSLPVLNRMIAANDGHIEQSIALQSIINLSILGHIQSPLPSKQAFDWAAGDELKILKQHVNAEFGLFLFVRAGFKTDFPVPEYQAGFISLVNLNSGDTVWFDHHMNIIGDFRDAEKAVDAMLVLMRDFPGIKTKLR